MDHVGERHIDRPVLENSKDYSIELDDTTRLREPFLTPDRPHGYIRREIMGSLVHRDNIDMRKLPRELFNPPKPESKGHMRSVCCKVKQQQVHPDASVRPEQRVVAIQQSHWRGSYAH